MLANYENSLNVKKYISVKLAAAARSDGVSINVLLRKATGLIVASANTTRIAMNHSTFRTLKWFKP